MRTWIAKLMLMVACLAMLLVTTDLLAQDKTKPGPGDNYEKLLEEIRKQKRVEEQHDKALADEYFKSGQKRFKERRFQEAEQNLVAALRLRPDHSGARTLLATVRELLGKTTTGDDNIIDRVRKERVVRLHYDYAVMLKAVSDAKDLLKEADYEEALKKLESALDMSKLLSRDLNVRREQAEIKALIENAHTARVKAEEVEKRKRIDAAKSLAEAEGKRLEELQDRRITRLFEDAKELYQQTRYLLAAKKAEEILKMDPRNKEVIAFRAKCHEEQRVEDVAWYDRTKVVETDRTWRVVRTMSIPFTQVPPLYPDDWDEKKKRTAGVSIETDSEEDAKWKKELLTRLEEPVSFDFIATPLDDVVAFLRNLKKVNIVVDKKATAARDNLDVTLKLDKVPFKDALSWVLRLLELKYALEDGAIYISTKDVIDKNKKTITSYYDVTDLTVEIRNFQPNLQAISNEDIGDAEEMQDIFGGDDDDDDQKDNFTGQSLVEFIKSVIAPDSWADVAGGGALDDF